MEPAFWTGGIGNDFIVDGAEVFEIELCQGKDNQQLLFIRASMRIMERCVAGLLL